MHSYNCLCIAGICTYKCRLYTRAWLKGMQLHKNTRVSVFVLQGELSEGEEGDGKKMKFRPHQSQGQFSYRLQKIQNFIYYIYVLLNPKICSETGFNLNSFGSPTSSWLNGGSTDKNLKRKFYCDLNQQFPTFSGCLGKYLLLRASESLLPQHFQLTQLKLEYLWSSPLGWHANSHHVSQKL